MINALKRRPSENSMNNNANKLNNFDILIEKIEKNIDIVKQDLKETDLETQDILIKEAIKFNRPHTFKTIVQIWLENKYNLESIPIEYVLQKNTKDCLHVLKDELPPKFYIQKLKNFFNIPFLFNNIELGLHIEKEIKIQDKYWSEIKDYQEIFLEAMDLGNKDVVNLVIEKDYILSDENLLKQGHKISILKENELYLIVNKKINKNLLVYYSKEEVKEQLLKAIYKNNRKAVEIYFTSHTDTLQILKDLYPEVIEKLSFSVIEFLIEKNLPISQESIESLEKIKNSQHVKANYVYELVSKTANYQKLDKTLNEAIENKKRVKL